MKDRLDKVLVLKGLARTRSQALLLIKSGQVLVNEKVLLKAATEVDLEDFIQVKKEFSYVGRGADKLKPILDLTGVKIEEQICADIGASTGGFTQVLLLDGAKKVYAIDVGSGQLAEELKADDRVINLEKTDVRDFDNSEIKFSVIVCDVSFISLRLILAKLFDLLSDNGDLLCLFKPQFELGNVKIKDGVIKDPTIHQKLLDDFFKWCQENEYTIRTCLPSPILGKRGNKEFFIHFKKI